MHDSQWSLNSHPWLRGRLHAHAHCNPAMYCTFKDRSKSYSNSGDQLLSCTTAQGLWWAMKPQRSHRQPWLPPLGSRRRDTCSWILRTSSQFWWRTRVPFLRRLGLGALARHGILSGLTSWVWCPDGCYHLFNASQLWSMMVNARRILVYNVKLWLAFDA